MSKEADFKIFIFFYKKISSKGILDVQFLYFFFLVSNLFFLSINTTIIIIIIIVGGETWTPAHPTKNGLGWDPIQLICKDGNVGQHFDFLRKQLCD